ncbi:MAG: 9-O-acetylesterase [Rubripirellula sp.]|nr:9-O-acetylesterase [Rubripirellula sp.]|tara:strand:+ start:513 stop:1877 length:1365 start_codon:yes stop_codon:yes gene_type:complete
MKFTHLLMCVSLCAAFLSFGTSKGHCDVKLPAVLDSHMVLQRNAPIHFWGWADVGEKVTVTMGDEVATTQAGKDGKWKVSFSPQKADKKMRTITVAGKNTIELTDVLVGEVWIGSGQSNMEWTLANTIGSAEAIAAADHPMIRLFHIPKVQNKEPASDVKADWKVCRPKDVPRFSAVLYYFGLQLQKELNVPIGLINSSWGGSPIEPWTIADGKSGGMYNGMIAPIIQYPAQGVIWYQGETNVLNKNGLAYEGKMIDLIEGWRNSFQNPDLAFYFVQIAPWSGRYETGELPKLWEAQVASLKLPGTGMAVTTDLVDNIADIHPRNKLDVGNRLALWALAKAYQRDGIVYSGPLYKSMAVEGDKVRLSFAHVAEGLRSRDEKPLSDFQISGADGKFVDAEAKVDGDTIVVSALGVKDPTTVRFGWNKIANPNLVNSTGLPASPFQTDDWQGGTGE